MMAAEDFPQPRRTILPEWPRLMSIEQAAAYIGLSPTTLRERGPEPKRVGSRVLYDRKDLDRWADRLGDQPLDAADEEKERQMVEREFLEARKKRRDTV